MNPSPEQIDALFATEKEKELFYQSGELECEIIMRDIKIEELEQDLQDANTLLAEAQRFQVNPEALRLGLFPIHQAQKMLEENYPNWNEAGKKYAVEATVEFLRDAHNRISQIYARLIGLPNV